MRRLLLVMVTALAGCLDDDPEDPRGPSPDAGVDGSHFDPGPKPPPRTGYGSGGSGAGSGARPPVPDGAVDPDAGTSDAEPGQA